MTDHLPECPMLDEQWPKHPLEKCPYCDMISACEKRVLDAARDAVAATDAPCGGLCECIPHALAAIDALREKP